MNREAVALGTPVYTIFSGRMGAVDERLIAAGLLRPLDDPAALELAKRDDGPGPRHPRDPELLADACSLGGESARLMFVDGRPENHLRAVRVPGRRGDRLAARPGRRAARVADRRRSTTRTSAACTRDPTPKLGGLAIFVGGRRRDDPVPALGRADPGAPRRRRGDRRVGVLDDVFELNAGAEARRADGRGGDPGPQRGQRRAPSRSRSSAASTCARSSSSTSP